MKHAPRPSTAGEDRYEEAALWFSKLRDGHESQLAPEELQAWQRFAADPKNRAAFEDVQRAAKAVRRIRAPRLPSAAALSADRFDGSMPVSQWRETGGGKAEPFSIRRWFGRRLVIASVAFASVVAGVLIAVLLMTHDAGFTQSYSTSAGHMREVGLPDGSRITLGGRTTLSVHYSRSKRLILFQQGEALFTVAHNRHRPFQVLAGGGTVTAVGTQFNVKHVSDRVTVTVTEGAVDVRPIDDVQRGFSDSTELEPRRSARVRRGQQLTYDQEGTFTTAEQTDLERAIAWREGRLEYRRAALKDVVEDVNRHFDQQIILGDEAVGELEFTGTVFQDQPVDEWLGTLERIFTVRIVRTDSKHVLIQSDTRRKAR